MALTTAQRDLIQGLIDRQSGYLNLPISPRVVEVLERIFAGTPGFPCECGGLRNRLREEPITTLLQLLLAASPAAATAEEIDELLDVLCPPVADLGTAEEFGIIGSSTVTNTGATTVDGDLGLSPGTSVVGYPPGVVLGTQHITDAVAAQAKADALVAYDVLRALPADAVLSGNIGGQTLGPGTYESATTLAISSGDLILDGQNDPCSSFNFNVGSALTVTASRKVVLINGALARNVHWTMGTSATLGANAVFRGTLIASASITAVTEGFVEGRLIALTGQVSTDTNFIELPV